MAACLPPARAVYAFLFGRFALIGDVAAAAAAAVAADGRMSAVLGRMAVFEAMLTLHKMCCVFAYLIC